MHEKLHDPQFSSLVKALSKEDISFFDSVLNSYSLTHQELKKLLEYSIDLNNWEEAPLSTVFNRIEDESIDIKNPRHKKISILKGIDEYYSSLKEAPIKFKSSPCAEKKPVLDIKHKESPAKILGYCPVKSPKTLCCKLRTLDAVLGCGFGCNYCALKSTYDSSNITFHNNFKEHLNSIEIEEDKLYHIGTGQSSDALMWGNKEGILDDLFNFAKKHPNVFLEFKTKSNNISYFLESDVPKNVFPSFTLNPQILIDNEEIYTNSLDERITAAKELNKKGIKVGFHFHPIVIFEGWEDEYKKISDRLLSEFSPDNIVFISLGTLFFPKPVLKQIRLSGSKTQIYKIPFTQNPEGKLTYPDEKKKIMFKHLYSSFKPWNDKVFFYLCMETKNLWEDLFGFSYDDNDSFEEDFLKHISSKLL